MSCEHITQLLAEGRSLDSVALDHLAACAGCRSMLAALSEPPPTPSAARLEAVRGLMAASLDPVNPLPSTAILSSLTVAVFVLFAVGAATPFGLYALHSMSALQKLTYWGVLLVLATLFSLATVEQIIPGAKRHLGSVVLSTGSVLGLGVLILLLFHDANMTGFVGHGIPCLRLGSTSAAAFGLLAVPLVRRGFLTSPFWSITLVGFFSGLAGFAVLALHCPLQNAPHVLIWHLGVVLLGGLGGTVTGLLIGGLPPRS